MVPILTVENLSKHFGGIAANQNISFEIENGSIVGVVGPNGAGKTTLFNSISRTHHLTSGKVFFDGEDITRLKPHQVCARGLGRTFQIPQIMEGMSVQENILIGAFCHHSKVSNAEKHAQETAEFCGIEGLLASPVEALNVMQKKRLEIARALAGDPKLLLLDEVMAGLNGAERTSAIKLIKKINNEGISILMIEHVMQVIMAVSQKVVVIVSGKKLMEGSPQEVTSNPEVISAYLGGDYHVGG